VRRSRIFAAADRRGVIAFVDDEADGLIAFATGPERKLRAWIEVTARHAYDSVTLLVPGVPEAEDDDHALEALLGFRDWIGRRPAPGCEVLW
jgi:hypothetical protein